MKIGKIVKGGLARVATDMDNGENVDVEEQPPIQQEETIQQVQKEEPKSHNTKVVNLSGIK